MTPQEEINTLVEDVKKAEMSIYSNVSTAQVEAWKARIKEIENMCLK